jgi:hypothetical protein
MKQTLLSLNIIFHCIIAYSQRDVKSISDSSNRCTKYFVAYDLGEMAFNKFQNFGGETGVQFKNKQILRFVYMNVKLTEEHLSSDFAKDVDGDHIRGLMKGYELFYDLPVIDKFNLGLSAGYYNDFYQHTISKESIENHSTTLGFAPGYRETDLLGVKGLYFNFVVPFRFYFNPLEKTKLGASTINRHFFTNNIWFFVGYQF